MRDGVAIIRIDCPGKVNSISGDMRDAAKALWERDVAPRADIKAVDRQGMTPLHVAASCERLSAIPILMRNGASQWAKNGPLQDGETPYQMAVSEGLHEVVRHALRHDAVMLVIWVRCDERSLPRRRGEQLS